MDGKNIRLEAVGKESTLQEIFRIPGMGNSYYHWRVFWKYSSHMYSIPSNSGFIITAPKIGKRKKDQGRGTLAKRRKCRQKGAWASLLPGWQRRARVWFSGVYGGMYMSADRLPAILLDSYCTGGWVLDSVLSQADPPTTEVSDSHLSEPPQHPEVWRGLLNKKELRAQAGAPQPSMSAMDMGSGKICADRLKPLLSSVTLIYTLSCHLRQEQKEEQEIWKINIYLKESMSL